MYSRTILARSFVATTPTYLIFFFFNDTATTEIYTLSLHDALPILIAHLWSVCPTRGTCSAVTIALPTFGNFFGLGRSEEHTSELQSPDHLVCRLLLEKKNRKCNDASAKALRVRRALLCARTRTRPS